MRSQTFDFERISSSFHLLRNVVSETWHPQRGIQCNANLSKARFEIAVSDFEETCSAVFCPVFYGEDPIAHEGLAELQ